MLCHRLRRNGIVLRDQSTIQTYTNMHIHTYIHTQVRTDVCTYICKDARAQRKSRLAEMHTLAHYWKHTGGGHISLSNLSAHSSQLRRRECVCREQSYMNFGPEREPEFACISQLLRVDFQKVAFVIGRQNTNFHSESVGGSLQRDVVAPCTRSRHTCDVFLIVFRHVRRIEFGTRA